MIQEAFQGYGFGLEEIKVDNITFAEIVEPIFVNDRG